MRVLYDGRCLQHEHVGGVQRYACELLAALQKRGCPVEPIYPRCRSAVGRQLWEQFVLPRASRGYEALLCPANMAPWRLPRRIRLIVTLHSLAYLRFADAYSPAFRIWYRLMIPRILARADAVLTVSHASADEIAKEYPQYAGKLHVTPLAASAAFRPAPDVTRDRAIVYVGDLSRIKNLHRLLEAFAQIAKDIPHALWIVGGRFGPAFASPPSWADAIARIEPNRIRFLGPIVNAAELSNLYCKAEILALPSLYESFGLPAIEAMACGLPVLASDIPALRETVDSAALLVDPTNSTAMAEGLYQLATSSPLRAELSRRGLERAATFSWDRCAAQTWEILEQSFG